jgi:hypothetical protein
MLIKCVIFEFLGELKNAHLYKKINILEGVIIV